ncbi:integral membrane sensor signal transduction histidine kinase [Caballeronia temeraria]|uniref:histidine kinase n=1 Tax=Caballeronia temeraria TaxID=1777137 RepID=A0A158CKJ2_9BURK|nr:ATP-binding protein [Caballeronia temeraria]SAK82893.1 integral membrane sensor signal transduction histidine kinase [Caballeronia temeraria]
MDTHQSRTHRSMTARLTWWIVCVVVALSVIAGAASFAAAYHEANRLQDGHLGEIGALIDAKKLVLDANAVAWQGSRDSDVRLVIARLGHPSEGENAATPIIVPATLPDGLHNLEAHGKRWRVDVRTLHSGDRIAVAELSMIRDEIARDGAMRTLLPMLALTPVLVALVVFLVRRMLLPVRRLASVVDLQDDATLDALSDKDIPNELLPFVTSINRLIGRLKEAMTQQRRFIADAAHELRSPLAALSLQAEHLSAADTAVVARERLVSFHAAIRRTARLVEQLLALARSQHGSSMKPSVISLRELATDVVIQSVNLAQDKHVDLGLDRVDDVDVIADAPALAVVLRNLVDNAVRYTPQGGRVDVSVTLSGRELLLEVKDSGPGIPDDELSRVLEPFYRIPGTRTMGSGLGLSIVSETARRSGARFVLQNTDAGLRACYAQPLSEQSSEIV